MSKYAGLKARLSVCAKYDKDQADAIAAITELEALLDECEQALADIQDYSSRPVITATAKDTLAKLRAHEKDKSGDIDATSSA